jgi:hypothetical protein
VTSRTISSWAYAAVWVGALLDQFLGLAWAGQAAGLLMLLFLLLEFPRQRRFAMGLFLGITAIGLIGVARADHPLALFLAGWRRGATYGAFFLALSSLRDAAETSPLVRRCGHHLATRPPGLRYLALNGGGHLFGIILSYGSIDLLGAMVGGANTHGDAQTRAARGRRMLMAIQRGFCVMNCWSPLNLMTAIVSTAVPAAPMRTLIPFAFIVSLGMSAIGWLEDRIRGRAQTETRPPEGTSDGWSIHLGIVGLVGLVLLLAEASNILFGITLVAAVTLAVPLVALIWAVGQHGWRVRLAAIPGIVGHRLTVFRQRLPDFRGEAATLACSGFMGVTAAGIIPGALIAPVLSHLPGVTLPLLVPVVLIATGQAGLNPVAIVALLGAAVPDPAGLGISPAVLAFSCMLGWGMGVSMTPLSASAIITARWAGVSPWTVGSVWNIWFGSGCLLLSWAMILLAARMFPV